MELLNILVEILVTYLQDTKPDIKSLQAISVAENLSKLLKKQSVCVRNYAGIILMELNGLYGEDYKNLVSSDQVKYFEKLRTGHPPGVWPRLEVNLSLSIKIPNLSHIGNQKFYDFKVSNHTEFHKN